MLKKRQLRTLCSLPWTTQALEWVIGRFLYCADRCHWSKGHSHSRGRLQRGSVQEGDEGGSTLASLTAGTLQLQDTWVPIAGLEEQVLEESQSLSPVPSNLPHASVFLTSLQLPVPDPVSTFEALHPCPSFHVWAPHCSLCPDGAPYSSLLSWCLLYMSPSSSPEGRCPRLACLAIPAPSSSPPNLLSPSVPFATVKPLPPLSIQGFLLCLDPNRGSTKGSGQIDSLLSLPVPGPQSSVAVIPGWKPIQCRHPLWRI